MNAVGLVATATEATAEAEAEAEAEAAAAAAARRASLELLRIVRSSLNSLWSPKIPHLKNIALET